MTIGPLLMLLMAPAQAQTAAAGAPPGARPERPEGWTVIVGGAALLRPAWEGSRDMSLSLLPDLRVTYGDRFFASVPEGIGFNVVNGGGWKAGPLVKVRFGRDEDNGGSPFRITGRSDALEGMGDVNAAAELGGFVEKSFGSRGQWRLRGEVRRGFGGHEGLVADASLNARVRAGRTIISFGPRLSAASSDYMQTFFGIDADQSLRTGLARYKAGGGLLSYGAGGTVIRPLDRRSAITLFTSLERLAGPAADSPLIRERGRPTQFTLGIGYGFSFGL